MTIFNLNGDLLFQCPDNEDPYFSEQKLMGADFRGETIEGLVFDGADLEGADFTGADLYWVSLMSANCDRCKFVGADLRGAMLYGATFRGADFSHANLSFDALSINMTLDGIDLSQALLDEANLVGATYDSATVLPNGFDPAAHKMIYQSEKDDRIS